MARRRTEFLAAALLLLAATAGAATPSFPLRAVQAAYATSLNGMPLGVELALDLHAGTGNGWTLAMHAASGLYRYDESSEFRWNGCSPEPQRYRFEFHGLGIDRHLALDFDHAKGIAAGNSRKGPVSFAFPGGAADELSFTFGARCHLAQGHTDVTFDIATTAGMRKYRYRVEGNETIATPYGKIDTLRIERVRDKDDRRRTTLWVAPGLDYMLVKMEHVEKLGVRATIALKKIDWR